MFRRTDVSLCSGKYDTYIEKINLGLKNKYPVYCLQQYNAVMNGFYLKYLFSKNYICPSTIVVIVTDNEFETVTIFQVRLICRAAAPFVIIFTSEIYDPTSDPQPRSHWMCD